MTFPLVEMYGLKNVESLRRNIPTRDEGGGEIFEILIG